MIKIYFSLDFDMIQSLFEVKLLRIDVNQEPARRGLLIELAGISNVFRCDLYLVTGQSKLVFTKVVFEKREKLHFHIFWTKFKLILLNDGPFCENGKLLSRLLRFLLHYGNSIKWKTFSKI